MLTAHVECTYVAETRSHHDGLIAVLFVVIVDLLDGLNTGIVVALVILSSVFLIPVEDLCQVTYVKRYDLEGNVLPTLPTKGEMSVTPASAHATACAKPKRRVRLQ